MNFSVEELYGVPFDEFCKNTKTPYDLYITIINAEIAMLQVNYVKTMTKFRELNFMDADYDYYSNLLDTIKKEIEKKRRKLKKYERYKCESR